jgi:hypothetical protein
LELKWYQIFGSPERKEISVAEIGTFAVLE